MSSRASQHVCVVMGGFNSEREVSLSSGAECAAALRDAGYRVTELDAGRDMPLRLAEIAPDVVFNALHGEWGEDGAAQGVFEWMGIAYTNSGVMASALAMDKDAAKAAYRGADLPVVDSVLATLEEIGAAHVMDPPYVVKPNAAGSSVGVILVHEGDAPPRPNVAAGTAMMVETYVPGRELTTTVMGDRPLGVTEILTDGWYDYAAKYEVGGSRHVIPAELPAEITAACEDYALRAHRALGCRGVSRTDFRWDEGRGLAGLVLLETNTQPGMTPTSLTPEQAAHHGISFPQLCAWMVEDASCRR